MSIERSMYDLEKHIDYVNHYFAEVQSAIENLEIQYQNQIVELKNEVSILEEQSILLTEQLEDSQELVSNMQKENAMINLELAEVTGQLIHMRYELDLSRKGV
jgi:predicted  nucleic acid-binding Zn-ribbon protein